MRAGWWVDHFTADDPPVHALGRDVVTPIQPCLDLPCIIGIGYPQPRAELLTRYGDWLIAPPVVDPTGMVASSATLGAGTASEIAATIAEKGFTTLKAPPVRVARADVPTPFSAPLEAAVTPDRDKVIKAVRRVLA